MMASSTMKRSMDDLLSSSQEVLGNTLNQMNQALSTLQRSPSPVRKNLLNPSPPKVVVKEPEGNESLLSSSISFEEIETKSRDSTCDEYLKISPSSESNKSDSKIEKSLDKKDGKELVNKSQSKVTERAKKKSWYSVLYPSYKSRCEDFKKLFKEVPDDDRLIVDYSSAIQKDILVHGRLYVSQNYLCFHANIIVYETKLVLRWKDVTSIVKDKTAKLIPNAISVFTENEKYFFTSFTSRDKTYLMLFRVWQNSLMNTPMNPQELWQQVHSCYGDELGLTSDDEDYIDPYDINLLDNNGKLSAESGSGDISVSDVNNLTNSSSGQQSDTIVRKPTTLKLQSRINSKTKMKKGELSPIEQIPTDLSDNTSDSDTGTNAETSVMEQESVECDSMHEGRQLVHTILPINVDNLFSLLFAKSKFFLEFHDSRRTTDLVLGEWNANEDGIKERCVTLTVAINQAIGPKCSHVTETQKLRQCSRDGSLYSVDIESVNAGIPYADSFSVFLHYCLSRTMDDHTVLSVHAQIKYKKSVWGVVKGFIEKNTWVGLEDFFHSLLKALQTEYCIPPAKAKPRRTRRGNSLQQNKLLLTDPIAPAFKKENVPILVASKSVVVDKVEKLSHESFLSWIVVFLLLALIIVNVFLYYKLRSLEYIAASTDYTISSDYMSKVIESHDGNTPESHAEWLKILQQQEIYHAKEMQKWQSLLTASIEMLKKIEVTLNNLQQLIVQTKQQR